MAGVSSIQQPRTHLEQSNEASPEPSLCQAKTPIFSRVPRLTGFPNPSKWYYSQEMDPSGSWN